MKRSAGALFLILLFGCTARTRVFMTSGEGDLFMLARAMKSILDEAGIENKLYVDQGAYHYNYRGPNFERYRK